MKKTAALLLLFLFLLTNSGMALSMHWCGGKLASISFLSIEKHSCKCGKKTMKPGCCKDKITHLKANDELNKTNVLTFKISVPKLEVDIQTYPLIPKEVSPYSGCNFYHPPPYKPKSPIYLLDQVFLI